MRKLLYLFLIFLFFSSTLHAIEKIGIGTISVNSKKKIASFQFLADYLQEKLGDQKVDIVMSKNIKNSIELIKKGKLHIFIDSLYSTILVKREIDIDISCKRWKEGVSGYRSFIYTRYDSDINTLSDLKGKKIAFEDLYSTSGFYIPKKAIEKSGLEVTKDYNPNGVSYIFSQDDKNGAVWTLFSKVDASVVDDNGFKDFDKGIFKIIYKSKLIPRHLVSFSKNVDKDLKKRILEILYSMEKDKKGIEVLEKFSKTKRFSPLTKDDLIVVKDI